MSTPFLSATSANALISDLRPTTLAPSALTHINLLLDEVLALLVSQSQSINPLHLRSRGIPAVFSADKAGGETTGLRALGRSAVGEAELEVRSWYDGHPEGRSGARSGFPPDGQGDGMKREGGRFPVKEAVELLKLKSSEFSTLADQSSNASLQEKEILRRWKEAGGDCSEETLAPAGLWTTAILEHICEHILTQLARVVARDSSITVAGAEDLYVALCEDESIWGLFKRLQVKDSLETAIRTGGRAKKNSLPKSVPLARLNGASTPPKRLSSYSPDPSILEYSPSNNNNINNGTSSTPPRSHPPVSSRNFSSPPRKAHERSGSLLSFDNRNVVNHGNDPADPSNLTATDRRRPSADEEEFDALVRSGETMKVSLTPSRLKNFDGNSANSKRTTHSSNMSRISRNTRSQSPSLSELSLLGPHSNPTNAYEQPSHKTGTGSTVQHLSPRRLVARSAVAAEGRSTDGDDAAVASRQGRKESLADMFASDDVRNPDSNAGAQRTVPAVILGAPPPRDKSNTSQLDSQPSAQAQAQAQVHPPRSHSLAKGLNIQIPGPDRNGQFYDNGTGNGNENLNAIGTDIDDVDDEFEPRRRKPRSEAQELADFLSNTPPPPSSSTISTSRTYEEPPKSGKSFKSFVSRMTGRKKDKDFKGQGRDGSDGNIPPVPRSLSTSVSQATLGEGNASRRQTSTSALGSTHTHGAMQVLNASVSTSALRPERLGENDRLGLVRPTAERQDTGSSLNRLQAPSADLYGSAGSVGAEEDSVPPSDAGSSQFSQIGSRSTPSSRVPTTPAARARAVGDPAEQGLGETTPTRTNSALSHDAGYSPTTPKASEHVLTASTGSFRTANEGESPVRTGANATATEDATARTGTSAIATAQAHERVPAFLNSVDAPVPEQSIPGPAQTAAGAAAGRSSSSSAKSKSNTVHVSHLIPLRNLFQHATSVRECQLLLSAALGSLGVPARLADDDVSGMAKVEVTPEARVMAWLLSGRDGPDYHHGSGSGSGRGQEHGTGRDANESNFPPAINPMTTFGPSGAESNIHATEENGGHGSDYTALGKQDQPRIPLLAPPLMPTSFTDKALSPVNYSETGSYGQPLDSYMSLPVDHTSREARSSLSAGSYSGTDRTSMISGTGTGYTEMGSGSEIEEGHEVEVGRATSGLRSGAVRVSVG